MKNLFIINEEEKNRILNLHESATKRHYLNEEEELYRKAGENGTNIVVNSKGVMVRQYIPSKDDNLKDYASLMAGYGQKNKSIQNTVTQNKTTQKNVTKTSCPVGDTKAVMLFQEWLDSNHKGWLPKYPDGLNKEVKKGYGMCGPNTRKAWSQYQTEYKVKFVPKPVLPGEGDDVVVPEPSQPNQTPTQPNQTPTQPNQTPTQSSKQSSSSQKSYNTGIGVDNDFMN